MNIINDLNNFFYFYGTFIYHTIIKPPLFLSPQGGRLSKKTAFELLYNLSLRGDGLPLGGSVEAPPSQGRLHRLQQVSGMI